MPKRLIKLENSRCTYEEMLAERERWCINVPVNNRKTLFFYRFEAFVFVERYKRYTFWAFSLYASVIHLLLVFLINFQPVSLLCSFFPIAYWLLLFWIYLGKSFRKLNWSLYLIFSSLLIELVSSIYNWNQCCHLCRCFFNSINCLAKMDYKVNDFVSNDWMKK